MGKRYAILFQTVSEVQDLLPVTLECPTDHRKCWPYPEIHSLQQ